MGRGVYIFTSPPPCPVGGGAGRGKDICGVPSPSIMGSLLHDKVKGAIYSPLDSHPGVGDPRPSGVSFPPSERGGKNTGVTCELPSC